MCRPIVSIITPTYNSANFIMATIASVQQQTFRNWEMIIVDDCSVDETVNVVDEVRKTEKRIKLLRNNENVGQGITRNRAIEISQGRFIAFLDSDDLWHRDKLSRQIKALSNSDCAMSHTSFVYIDANGHTIKSPLIVSKKPVSYQDILLRTEIGCLTAMYDTLKVGKMYMPDLPRSQDYALWLSILREGHYSHPIQEPLAYYRIHENNISKDKWKKISYHWVVLRKYERLNIVKSFYYIGSWAINGLVRYVIK